MTATNVRLQHASGAEAEVLVSQGFNCHRFAAATMAGPVEVLWAEEGYAEGGKRPSGSGWPILFPFPGRLQGESFRWEGETYHLPAGDGQGNAIHGFVHERPWRITEQSDDRLVGEFQASIDDAEILKRWPADFHITAEIQLQAVALTAVYTVRNPSQIPLPCGLGLHPYFRVPLGEGEAEKCTVRLPVASRWPLVDMLPTGERVELEEPARYATGLDFTEMSLDDVFSGLQFAEDGWARAELRDHASGHAVTIEFDRMFRECVVYNPPHREAICVEPYTCVPDAFRLREQGVDTGLRLVPPGSEFQAQMVVSVE